MGRGKKQPAFTPLICSAGCSQLPGLVALGTRCNLSLGAISSHRRDHWHFPSLPGAGAGQPRISHCLFAFPTLSSFDLGQIYAVRDFPIQWFVNISVKLHKSTFPMPGQCRSKGKRQLLFCPLKRQERDENGVVFCDLEEAKHIAWNGSCGRRWIEDTQRSLQGSGQGRACFSPRE